MSLIISAIIIVLSVIIDQVTKFAIDANFSLHQSKPVIEGFLNFTYLHNDGSAFSMMRGQMTFFYIITVVALVFFVYYLIKTRKEGMLQTVCLSLIIGGIIGNFIDRVKFQYVRDFIAVDIDAINFHFAVFNFADMCLVVGVLAFIVILLIELIQEIKNEKASK